MRSLCGSLRRLLKTAHDYAQLSTMVDFIVLSIKLVFMVLGISYSRVLAQRPTGCCSTTFQYCQQSVLFLFCIPKGEFTWPILSVNNIGRGNVPFHLPISHSWGATVECTRKRGRVVYKCLSAWVTLAVRVVL